MQTHEQLEVGGRGRGLWPVTREVEGVVARSGVQQGLCVVFCRHTSASLLIGEAADPDVCVDLEAWASRLVQDGDPLFTHTCEGPDDMSAHVKAALTRTSETIPVIDGRLALGTWQGIFLWEHRDRPHRRKLIVTVSGE